MARARPDARIRPESVILIPPLSCGPRRTGSAFLVSTPLATRLGQLVVFSITDHHLEYYACCWLGSRCTQRYGFMEFFQKTFSIASVLTAKIVK
jgi:hypothetical protein